MRTRIVVGTLLVALALGVHGQPGGVDDQRLLGAGTDRANWLNYGRDYGNQRFSPLAQIDAGNVRGLRPRWIYQSGVPSTFQATPIVADGVMYLSLPFNHVVALDARSGTRAVALHAQTAHRQDVLRPGQSRRGGGLRQGVHGYGRCAPDRARCRHRQARVGHAAGGGSGRSSRAYGSACRRRSAAQADGDRRHRCRARTWRRWSTRARSSSGSPAWATACTSIRIGPAHRSAP